MIFIPVVLEESMGANRLVIGLVVTCYATALFFSSIFLGRFADIRGRRAILRIGFALATITTFAQAFATDVIQLTIVRILLGLAAGTVPSVLVAYFLYETRAGVGKFASFGALGWGFGSIMSGLFGDPEAIFIFAGGLMVIAGIAVFKLPRTQEITHSIPLFPKTVFRENAPIYVSFLIRHTGAHMVWVTYPLFLMDELGADKFWVGIIYAINALTQFFVMRRLDRISSSVLVRLGLGLSTMTFILFTLTRTYFEIAPLQVLLAISFSSLYVGSLKHVNERSSEKATATGWLSGVISIAGITGPVMGGYLNDLIDYRMTMIVAAFLCILSLAIFILFSNRRNTALNKTV